MSLIKNASPEFIALGAKDLSTRVVLTEDTVLPQHIPLFFVHTKKGTEDRTVVNGSTFNSLFSNESLDPNGPYYNHQTRYLTAALAHNDSVMIQRIVGNDHGPKANFVLYIDILETNLVNYLRDSNGNYIPDENNEYRINEEQPIVRGYKIKWIKEWVSEEDKLNQHLGEYIAKPGTMVNEDGQPSMMYPIFEARASNYGKFYNTVGLAVGSQYGEDLNETFKEDTNSLPFNLYIYNRPTETSSPVVFDTLFGEPYAEFSFRDKAVYSITEQDVNINNVFASNWYNTINPDLPYVYPDIEGFYFYSDNYKIVTTMIVEKEKNFVTNRETVWGDNKKSSTVGWYDFTSALKSEVAKQNYMINPFSLQTSRKVKYFTVQYDNRISTAKNKNRIEVNLTATTPIFLSGGRDGDMTDINFEKQVVKYVSKYNDKNSSYHDLAVNVENVIWDSGFTIPTKKELMQFIALRKDTVLVLSTHEARLGTKHASLSQTRAIGVSLKTRFKLTPESTYYNTPVARGMIVAGSALLRDGSTSDRVPITYEIMIKTSKLMGGKEGVWDTNMLFDRVYDDINNSGSKLQYMVDVEPKHIPASVKPVLWSNGIVWAQPFDLSSYHFPGLQTVYDNDTSVLNSFFTAMALSVVTRKNAEAWRRFTGSTDMTDGEFTDMVETWLRNSTANIFGNMFYVTHDVYLTDNDKLRGYSWRQVSTLYGNNMKSKTVYTTQVARKSDLENNTEE